MNDWISVSSFKMQCILSPPLNLVLNSQLVIIIRGDAC